jgi:membrane-associated HD superfamily phosphohydrolase
LLLNKQNKPNKVKKINETYSNDFKIASYLRKSIEKINKKIVEIIKIILLTSRKLLWTKFTSKNKKYLSNVAKKKKKDINNENKKNNKKFKLILNPSELYFVNIIELDSFDFNSLPKRTVIAIKKIDNNKISKLKKKAEKEKIFKFNIIYELFIYNKYKYKIK